MKKKIFLKDRTVSGVKAHGEAAVEVLIEQLRSAKSESKKRKLRNRIGQWQQILSQMERGGVDVGK